MDREEDVVGEETISLGLSPMGCSLMTGSQDTDFDRMYKSWSHCLTGGRSQHEFINRAGLAHLKYSTILFK